jgi:class 3 adenylate cyclase
MRCSKCGAENREGARFCDKCGANLSPKCLSCGAEYRPYAKFCDSCGAVLDESASPADTKPKQPPRTERDAERLEGERRYLSVVFCDLVDSTGLSHHLDPEESRAIVLPYQRAVARVVEHLGGHVAKFLGDGVMALFGWPQAHEDDADRAIRAALSIIESISALNQQSEGLRLSARIGIHTGTAVIAAGGDSTPDVFGDASNLASRAQNEADSNTVVITASTQQVVAGRFVVESLGEKSLKGIDEPVELFRVLRPSGMQRHLATASARGLTPFVGREDEMRTLMSRWELARKGEGQVVLIVGEAGIGKSRLVQQFREQVLGTPHSWIQTEFSPYLQNTPLASVADMIQQALGWNSGDSVEAKLAQLERHLEPVGLKPAEALPLISPLLNLPVSEKYPPPQLSPEQQREQLLATLTGWLFGMARRQPLVMVLEDMHWSDPSTLELQQVNVEQGATVPLLLVYTARPEFRPPWPMLAHHTQINLGRLRDRDVREMVHAVAAKAVLTEPMVAAVTSRSSGVPLFVEELTRSGSRKWPKRGDRHP